MAYGLTEQSVNGHFRDWMEKGQSDATTAFWVAHLSQTKTVLRAGCDHLNEAPVRGENSFQRKCGESRVDKTITHFSFQIPNMAGFG